MPSKSKPAEHDVTLFFNDCSLWKKIVHAAGSVVPELNIRLSEEGLRGQAFDATKTCYVDLKIHPEGIDEFDCLTPSQIALDLHMFHQVMKIGFPKDQMKMTHDDGAENLHITFTSPRGDRQSDFDVSLVDQSLFQDYPEPPNLDINADFIVEMKSEILYKIVRAYEDMTNSGVEFAVSQSKVEMSVIDPIEFNGRVIHNLSDTDNNKTKVIRKGDEDLHTQTFHINPWVKYTRGYELADRVKLYFESRQYAVLEYSFGDIGYLRFYVSPREDDLTQTFTQLSQTA